MTAAPEHAPYFAAIDRIAPWPDALRTMRAALNDAAATAATVARAVELDVAFSTRLLRLVNSPAAGLLRPCLSVAHAVSLVGMRRVGMLVEATASEAAVEKCAAVAPELSARALKTSGVARALATWTGSAPENAYTAALLADIGEIAILAVERGAPAAKRAAARKVEPRELGGEILRRWNIPAPIPQVVALRDDLAKAEATGHDVGRLAALIVATEALTPIVDRETSPPEAELVALCEGHAFKLLRLDPKRLCAAWAAMRQALGHGAEAPPAAEPPPVTSSEVAEPESRRPNGLAVALAILVPAAIAAFALLR